jgi:hypothetical protein
VNSDHLWYLALAAGVVGGAAYRRRHPTAGQPAASDTVDSPPVDHDQVPVESAAFAAEPDLRPLDTVVVRCERFGHIAAPPGIVLSRTQPSGALRTLERQQWAGTPRANLCRYHNPGGHPLDTLHITCDSTGCGERGTLRYDEIQGGFARLRSDGWRNRGDRTLCPYCAGTRHHRTW